MAKKFDAIIIGTGQSGPALAARMTQEGMKTAIIERKLFGGTCVNVGCTPTKALVASARAAYMARRGSDFGTQRFAVDLDRVGTHETTMTLAHGQVFHVLEPVCDAFVTALHDLIFARFHLLHVDADIAGYRYAEPARFTRVIGDTSTTVECFGGNTALIEASSSHDPS